MKWQKYTWEDGDLITTQKLNHIEYGIDRVESSSTSKAGARSLMVWVKLDPVPGYHYLDIEPDKLVQAIKSGVNVMFVTLNQTSTSLEVNVMNGFQDNSETEDFDSESLPDHHYYNAEIVIGNNVSFRYSISNGWVKYPKFFREVGGVF